MNQDRCNMTYNTEADLHALLDGLTNGEHVKATWTQGAHLATAEGPVLVSGRHCSCFHIMRWKDGEIEPSLTALEVAREEEVTVTRDDEKALHALLDSLENGEEVTAGWGNGSMSITGMVRASGPLREVMYGYGYCELRRPDGVLHHFLHSVTARRAVVQRWERDGDE